jgi:hypothetical protein
MPNSPLIKKHKNAKNKEQTSAPIGRLFEHFSDGATG